MFQTIDSYVAAIVEYQPIGNAVPEVPHHILELNAENYVKFISEAKAGVSQLISISNYFVNSTSSDFV